MLLSDNDDLPQSLRAIYSASAVEVAVIGCLLLFHATGYPSNVNT